jgi:hypothetical protein
VAARARRGRLPDVYPTSELATTRHEGQHVPVATLFPQTTCKIVKKVPRPPSASSASRALVPPRGNARGGLSSGFSDQMLMVKHHFEHSGDFDTELETPDAELPRFCRPNFDLGEGFTTQQVVTLWCFNTVPWELPPETRTSLGGASSTARSRSSTAHGRNELVGIWTT